jgi:hypothetical protein
MPSVNDGNLRADGRDVVVAVQFVEHLVDRPPTELDVRVGDEDPLDLGVETGAGGVHRASVPLVVVEQQHDGLGAALAEPLGCAVGRAVVGDHEQQGIGGRGGEARGESFEVVARLVRHGDHGHAGCLVHGAPFAAA